MGRRQKSTDYIRLCADKTKSLKNPDDYRLYPALAAYLKELHAKRSKKDK